MTTISIIGTGNMGGAIAGIAAKGGAEVQLVARGAAQTLTGDIVVLAVPYPAVDELLANYGDQLAGKTVVDITNPLDFATFDGLVVPADSSAAAVIAAKVPDAHVVKAFNTNFAATLASGLVGDQPTTVLVAGDDQGAKDALLAVVRAGGLRGEDAGSLSRARELEALGFLQLTLAVGEKIGWNAGFALVK
ncbi:MAG: NADPH-dependent F420 reductase [Micrococcales bacterium]|nr:NADPH-dependent F420 reductase [Micrococcales bacterium]OJX69284.1 MAG: diguanylate cyclase [Micrococcales bacterium 72-143]